MITIQHSAQLDRPGLLDEAGVSGDWIECWRRDGIRRLMPLQRKGVEATALLRGGNVAVFAPPSAGKTFLGELALSRCVAQGKSALFLAPTRSLADELYGMLSCRYRDLGLRTAISTRDRTAHDRAIRNGRFDAAVMVYEKFRALAGRFPDMLDGVGLVVADEIQLIGDPHRGPCVDAILTELVNDHPAIQVVALSGVLAGTESLCQWLDAEPLLDDARPLELREGIFCARDGSFTWNDAAEETTRRETWLSDAGDCPSGDMETHHLAVVAHLVARFMEHNEATLVFVPTRRMSYAWSSEFCRRLGFSGRWHVSPELDDLESSCARERLRECLMCRVGFHNADLSPPMRRLVEEAFHSGEIGVLVATPTLSQGVNLRARNVIQVPLMARNADGEESAARRVGLAPLSVERYRNQGGRAGRPGSGNEPGRSILVAGSPVERDRLMDEYVRAPLPRLDPILSDASLGKLVMARMLKPGKCRFGELLEDMKRTFLGSQAPPDVLERRLAELTARWLRDGLLDVDASHELTLSTAGGLVAGYGLSVRTAMFLHAWCRVPKSEGPSPFETLLACAFSLNEKSAGPSVSRSERAAMTWPTLVRTRFEKEIESLPEMLASRITGDSASLTLAAHQAMKRAVLAWEWVSEKRTAELEQEYRLFSGAFGSLGLTMSWMVLAAAACGEKCGWPLETCDALRDLGQRLPKGLCEGAGYLATLDIGGLSRNFALLLVRNGYRDIASLAASGSVGLSNMIPAGLAELVAERAAALLAASEDSPGKLPGEWFDAALIPTDGLPASCGLPVAREDSGEETVDGKKRKHPGSRTLKKLKNELAQAESERPDLAFDFHRPGEILFRGKRIRLAPKPFALLQALARHAGRTLTYPEIDQLVWPREKVEPQQISAHKMTLVKKLGEVCGPEEARGIVQTDARYGIRLNLSPNRVCLAARFG